VRTERTHEPSGRLPISLAGRRPTDRRVPELSNRTVETSTRHVYCTTLLFGSELQSFTNLNLFGILVCK
jgi:hypothetical protein